ncbi:HIT family protein [Dermatophilaceae bacterium Sec6.4]
MSTLFEKIIDGLVPGHFVWQDSLCVAFLSIDPQTDGHTLVVPRTPVDQWLDADEELMAHLMKVAGIIGRAQRTEWHSGRVGLVVEGFLVPHLHIHVFPVNSPDDFDQRNVTHGQDQGVLGRNADRLRARLRSDGHTDVVPD